MSLYSMKLHILGFLWRISPVRSRIIFFLSLLSTTFKFSSSIRCYLKRFLPSVLLKCWSTKIGFLLFLYCIVLSIYYSFLTVDWFPSTSSIREKKQSLVLQLLYTDGDRDVGGRCIRIGMPRQLFVMLHFFIFLQSCCTQFASHCMHYFCSKCSI